MVQPLYRGFSTISNDGIDTRLYDIELVKQDLLNHFNTRIGERVARPMFGSIIHDLLFDLVDERTEGLVIADAQRIFSEDPRVVPLDVQVDIQPDEHEIKLTATLRMVEFDMTTNLEAVFSSEF